MTPAFFVPTHSYGERDTFAPVMRTQNLSQNLCWMNRISNIKGRAQYTDLQLLWALGHNCWLLTLASWIVHSWRQLCSCSSLPFPPHHCFWFPPRISLPTTPSAFHHASLYSYWLVAVELCCDAVIRSWNYLSWRRNAVHLLVSAPTSAQSRRHSFPSSLFLRNFKWTQCCLCVVPTARQPHRSVCSSESSSASGSCKENLAAFGRSPTKDAGRLHSVSSACLKSVFCGTEGWK